MPVEWLNLACSLHSVPGSVNKDVKKNNINSADLPSNKMYLEEELLSLDNHVGNSQWLVPVVFAGKTRILSSSMHLLHYTTFVRANDDVIQIYIFAFDYTKCMSNTMQVYNRFRDFFECSFCLHKLDFYKIVWEMGNTVSGIFFLSINC